MRPASNAPCPCGSGCGGPPGYERLLAVLGDPSHPEHEELHEWSDDHDPEALDLEVLDERVMRMETSRGGVGSLEEQASLPSRS